MIVKSLHLDGAGQATETTLDLSISSSWHHFQGMPDAGWVKNQTSMSSFAKMHLLTAETRPKTWFEDDELVISLRGMNFNENAAPEEMIAIKVWIKGDVIVTCCEGKSRSINALMEDLKNGHGAKTIPMLLVRLVEQLAFFANQFIDQLDAILDSEEDDISSHNFQIFHPKMNTIRRQVAFVKRYLAPQREALDRLYRAKVPGFDDRFYDLLYIQIDQYVLILEQLDILKERVLSLKEQFMAYVDHQQNSRLYVLAIVSAIFLPLSFVTGLLGINVGGVPGIDNPWAFTWVSGVSFILAIFMLIWFKNKKWF